MLLQDSTSEDVLQREPLVCRIASHGYRHRSIVVVDRDDVSCDVLANVSL